MRDIRARIAQRQGIDLSNHQIQDLAARRLESILDPRAMKPSLLEGLRRSASAVTPTVAPKASSEPVYTFEDTTIYDSPRATLRFIRRLLNPVLKLFFNPNPLIRALHLQARLNVEAAEREAERDRRQTEWNALHYEILQRVVTDVSRVSLELHALSTRVESLNARVDFNDRRVRSMEGGAQSVRAAARPSETSALHPTTDAAVPPEGTETPLTEGSRRRRRRRRGRRNGIPPVEQPTSVVTAPVDAPPTAIETPPADNAPPADLTDADLTAVTLEMSTPDPAAEYERGEVAASPAVPVPEPTVEPVATGEEGTAPQTPSSDAVDQPDIDRSDQ